MCVDVHIFSRAAKCLFVILLIQDACIRYLNINAPYQHEYVMAYSLVALWSVQSRLYLIS